MIGPFDLTYISCVLLTWYTPQNTPSPESAEGVLYPLPENLHVTLDAKYVESFDEIFIIGDVHGCYDELLMLIQKVDVPGRNILKILAGDLVVKGPKNIEVLDLVKDSNSIIAVRGNNEEKVLKEYFRMQNGDYELKKSDEWIRDLTPDHIRYLTELPYTISLPSVNAVVVHAGLLPGVQVEANDIHAMVNMRNIKINFQEGSFKALDNVCEGEAWASLWCGPQHVFFGHDSRRMLQIERAATGLDTGCVYGKNLTGIFVSGPRKSQFRQVAALKEYRVQKPKFCKK
ncbi:bis(5'-nucleosyl)-tetraphosphatase PrpE [asymmetrical]-like [Uloborus diversus]|uniref:bis(5'-nucleosyl)-tetraphosphatase PrpE [asymmetrical]-like n=1 Tax=Uloborus diversus TaxID=327109 RepID=UPI00240A4F64|nr:bis(5'-nucleosyl)-tetraphosphatase PrpE [asymmetrical]-like [Uloborus diversus]